ARRLREVQPRADRGAEYGGQERGGHALAHDVRDDDQQPRVADLEGVDVVAAHRQRRLAAPDGAAMRVGREARWQQGALDLGGDLELRLRALLLLALAEGLRAGERDAEELREDLR